MTFPNEPLPLVVEIAPGADLTADPFTWTWTDVTSSVRVRDGISISKGRPDELGRVSPSRCRLRLDNRSGDFAPRNPLGQWFGQLGKNTPLRVRLQWVKDTYTRSVSNSFGIADSGQAYTTSGGAASDYSVNGSRGVITLPTGDTAARSVILPDVYGYTDYRGTFRFSALATGNPLNAYARIRHAGINDYYRLQLEAETDGTVDAILTRVVAGSGTTLATSNDVATYSAASDVHWRVVVDGFELRAKVWTGVEPSTWTLEATDATQAFPTGQVGIRAQMASGNTNTNPTVSVDNLSVGAERFSGFVSAWPPRWDKSGRDASVPIEASGILRRLGQGAQPLRSAPTRYILGTSPVAYWTLEDGQLVASARPEVGSVYLKPFVGTHPSGAVVSHPLWGRGELAPWLPPVVSRGGNAGLTILAAAVAMPAFTNTWTVDFMYASGTDVAADTVDLIAAAIDINPSYLGGALGWPQLTLLPSIRRVAVSVNGESEVNATVSGLFDGNAHHIRWTASQSGGNVAWTVWVDGTSVNSGTTSGAMTLAAISGIGLTSIAPGGEQMAQGHVAIWTTPPTLADAVSAAHGHRGESADDRLVRLCAEEGVQLTIPSVSAVYETPMGPQASQTLLELLRECEDADQGVLHEEDFGLGYLPREQRYNRPVALAVDFDQGHIGGSPEPTDDDQQLHNRWTVLRRNGNSATVENADSISAVGLYDASIEVNHTDDTRLAHHASWRVHLGS